MDSKEFFEIRVRLGKTQKQLAQLLDTSVKAIQSFEQGWRSIPANIERQLLFLLAIKNPSNVIYPPCWVKQKCPDE